MKRLERKTQFTWLHLFYINVHKKQLKLLPQYSNPPHNGTLAASKMQSMFTKAIKPTPTLDIIKPRH